MMPRYPGSFAYPSKGSTPVAFARKPSTGRAADQPQRDDRAALRDRQASSRDRTADLRDKAADDNERALGRENGSAARARAVAAEDRANSTKDRLDAAEDRKQGAIEFDRAQLDDLTGFFRLGLGTTVLQREIDRARRSGGRLVFAYCDVDELKRVNDEHGHAAGDALLKRVAEALRSGLRSYDPVVRVGGDEFVCALSEISLEHASRIFNAIQGLLQEGPGGPSMSFGLTALRPGDDLATLLEGGDHDLRKAKSERNGRGEPSWRPDGTERWGAAELPSSPMELSKSMASLWTKYAGKKPTIARTEICGNVVTCILTDGVEDFNQCTYATQTGDTLPGVTEADYKREAVAAVVRLTHQRVVSFMSSHDTDTDVATEVFTLQRSAARGAPRFRREPETAPSLPPPRS